MEYANVAIFERFLEPFYQIIMNDDPRLSLLCIKYMHFIMQYDRRHGMIRILLYYNSNGLSFC